MRTSHFFMALNLILSANACRKSEGPKPLVVQAQDLEGTWLGTAGDAEDPAYAFQFTESEVDVMMPGDGALNCGGERPYHIVQKSSVAVDATAACKAAEFHITAIDANSIKMIYNGVRMSLMRSGPVRLEFFVSSSGAKETELSAGFRPYLVAPQDDSTIDAAFSTHKADYAGMQFRMSKDLPDSFTGVVSTFTLESEQYCSLIVRTQTIHKGEAAAIDDIQWEWPRDHDNTWHARNSLSKLEASGLTAEQANARLLQWQTGIITTKAARVNRVALRSADGLVILSCSRSLKSSLWTMEDLQDELKKMGSYVTLEKIQP